MGGWQVRINYFKQFFELDREQVYARDGCIVFVGLFLRLHAKFRHGGVFYELEVAS